MYKVYDDYDNKGKVLDKTEFMDINGFLMGGKKKVFSVAGSEIREIKVVSKNLANPIAASKVMHRYSQLVNYLTEVLIEDDGDDSDGSYREALNQIEKFRLMVKNEYRNFLTRKELEHMSKQLVILQKELTSSLMYNHKRDYLIKNLNCTFIYSYQRICNYQCYYFDEITENWYFYHKTLS